ncbi:MAG: hypothetical protein N4A44_00860 [Alphaproteobacteria bacterium]|jgi:hypothetical protein|nr:hypothetical protein [Alphaproteobacteria bacterium]
MKSQNPFTYVVIIIVAFVFVFTSCDQPTGEKKISRLAYNEIEAAEQDHNLFETAYTELSVPVFKKEDGYKFVPDSIFYVVRSSADKYEGCYYVDHSNDRTVEIFVSGGEYKINIFYYTLSNLKKLGIDDYNRIRDDSDLHWRNEHLIINEIFMDENQYLDVEYETDKFWELSKKVAVYKKQHRWESLLDEPFHNIEVYEKDEKYERDDASSYLEALLQFEKGKGLVSEGRRRRRNQTPRNQNPTVGNQQ